MDKYTSLSKVDQSLVDYKVNKKDQRPYTDTCEKCGKQFTFYLKDVKDRVIRCPYCGYDMAFFPYEYI